MQPKCSRVPPPSGSADSGKALPVEDVLLDVLIVLRDLADTLDRLISRRRGFEAEEVRDVR